ncbi:unnamed protein product, partial [marine sediment metagenome]
ERAGAATTPGGISYKITQPEPQYKPNEFNVERTIEGDRQTIVGSRGETFDSRGAVLAWVRFDVKDKEFDKPAPAKAKFQVNAEIVHNWINYSNLYKQQGQSPTKMMIETLPDNVQEAIKQANVRHSQEGTSAKEEAEKLAAGFPEYLEAPAEKAPELKPPIIDTTKSYIGEHARIMKRMRAGDITVDEVQEAFEIVASSEEAIKAELSKKTIKQLLPFAGMFARGRKKAEVVSMVYSNMLSDYAPGKGIQYAPFSETYVDGVRRAVNALTEEGRIQA